MLSIGHIACLQRILDNDADFVTPLDMLAELSEDNKQLTANMRETPKCGWYLQVLRGNEANLHTRVSPVRFPVL